MNILPIPVCVKGLEVDLFHRKTWIAHTTGPNPEEPVVNGVSLLWAFTQVETFKVKSRYNPSKGSGWIEVIPMTDDPINGRRRFKFDAAKHLTYDEFSQLVADAWTDLKGKIIVTFMDDYRANRPDLYVAAMNRIP